MRKSGGAEAGRGRNLFLIPADSRRVSSFGLLHFAFSVSPVSIRPSPFRILQPW
jgi:hypothetical protein